MTNGSVTGAENRIGNVLCSSVNASARVGGSGASVDLGVYRAASTWSEGTVTWTSSGGGATSGSAFDGITVVPGIPGWVEWAIPGALLHEWLDAVSPNNGLVLVSSSGKNRWVTFASRENATVANWPQLVVTYTE